MRWLSAIRYIEQYRIPVKDNLSGTVSARHRPSEAHKVQQDRAPCATAIRDDSLLVELDILLFEFLLQSGVQKPITVQHVLPDLRHVRAGKSAVQRTRRSAIEAKRDKRVRTGGLIDIPEMLRGSLAWSTNGLD